MRVEQVKQFKTYGEQVELLRQRGMRVNDPEHAETLLARLNYYRLSGYWYPMHRFSQGDGTARDEFVDGRLDPLIYLDPQRLSARARQRNKDGRSVHEVWLRKYQSALKASKEDFVAHHKSKYGGTLPIWAAVEIMDWGMLSYLYGMSPNIVRKRIAQPCDLTGPQLESWLKSLNILRNYAAHHARMFNRVYDIKPKLNNDVRLAPVAEGINRVFGQLSLIQYLHRQLDLSPADRLPKLFDTYPHNPIVPFSRIGAPDNWRELPLWRI